MYLTAIEVVIRVGPEGYQQDQNEAGNGEREKHALNHKPQPPVAA